MVSKFIFCWVLLLVFGQANAAAPQNKRVILTSGEKVYTLRFQLGLSTVLYFGQKPDIVICGNKNYFNIEKIKDGITIQPLANYSTNLTVFSGGHQYLFYLVPAQGLPPDGFVEVKWIPPTETRAIKPLASEAQEKVFPINRKAKILADTEITVLSEKSLQNGKRRIFEIELKNSGKKPFSTTSLEAVAAFGISPLERQITTWESESVDGKKTVRGRIIVSEAAQKSLTLVVGFQGKSIKIPLKGGKN